MHIYVYLYPTSMQEPVILFMPCTYLFACRWICVFCNILWDVFGRFV